MYVLAYTRVGAKGKGKGYVVTGSWLLLLRELLKI